MNSFFRWRRSAAALLVGVCASSPLAAQTTDEGVRQAMAAGSSARVIMRFSSAAARDAAFNRLLDRGAAVRATDTEAGPALVVLGSAAAFSSELVHATSVSMDADVAVASVTPARDRRRQASSGSRAQEYTGHGRGISVAVIDSGLQAHADLTLRRVRKFKDFVTGGSVPVDNCGHGTHVAGILAGDGTASFGGYAGMDPNVDLVVLRVLGDDCSGQTSDVIDALEWVGRNHATYNIKVVNLSLGHPVFESIWTDPLVQAVERLSRKGVVVVTAVGNRGISPRNGQPGYGGVGVPCNAPSSVCVGALDTKGTPSLDDDDVAAFSSRGPTRFDLLAKPDLVAAGVRVTSLSAPGSRLFTENPALLVFGGNEGPNHPAGYMTLNGTSMASPLVAGAAALMLEANGQLSANTVKLGLQFTARVLPNVDLLTQGAGALNTTGAVRLARLINPNVRAEAHWLRGRVMPSSNLDASGQTVNWGKRIIYGDRLINSAAAAVRLLRWDDNVVWGYDSLTGDNVVWGNDDNVVWGNDNVVWGNLDDDNVVWGNNIVWGENVVWGYWADNVVWGFSDDNVVWGNVTRATLDNVVWGNDFDNVVWGNCTGNDDNVVWGNNDGDNVVWGNCDDNVVWGNDDNVVWGNSVLTNGGRP
ncbi:MAG: S8 family peptidase [Vicinamibacterales bacterium]